MQHPSDTVRILACQIDIPRMTTADGRDRHLERTAAMIDGLLAEKSADIVVLPELASIDYSRASFDVLDTLAEPLDGPSFQCWRALARRHRTHVSYGFARKGDGGFYISVAVVDPEGALVGHYDKMHLAQYGASMEKDYFRRGGHLLAFAVKGFRFAPFICYDIRFPELARRLVVGHKVDVILHCGAYFRDPSFHTWHPFAITRALENQVHLLSLNRAGATYGNSLFCYPWMDETAGPVAFAAHDADFRYLTVDRQRMDDARREYTFLGDRRRDYDFDCSGAPNP